MIFGYGLCMTALATTTKIEIELNQLIEALSHESIDEDLNEKADRVEKIVEENYDSIRHKQRKDIMSLAEPILNAEKVVKALWCVEKKEREVEDEHGRVEFNVSSSSACFLWSQFTCRTFSKANSST